MRKYIVGVLMLSLICGCSSAVSDPPAQTPSSVPYSSQAEEEPADSGITYRAAEKQTAKIGQLISENRWDEVSLLAVQNTGEDHSGQALREAFLSGDDSSYSLVGSAPVCRNGHLGGSVILNSGDQVKEALFRFNDELKIELIRFAERPSPAEPEHSEQWLEQWITAGNAPQIQGILTLPVQTSEEAADSDDERIPPSVAVLMPEELDDAMNESGSNTELRKDLAHALAEHGIASVRFDMRGYEEPLLSEVFGYDLDLLLNDDIASIFHQLETHPVNARDIIYVGHGAGGTMGYSHVYHHFEVTGGLVLINSPFCKDGVHLFSRASWLSEELADEAAEKISEEAAGSEYTGGYPLSWWRQWDSMGALQYTRYVAIPILIQQGKDDAIVLPDQDYENWKTQKGSNVTMKLYEGIGHDLREESGMFCDLIAEDIADWQNGTDINRKKKEEEKPEASPSASPASGKRT